MILPIKPNSRSSLRNKDTSIRCDDLFSEEANSSASSRNQDTCRGGADDRSMSSANVPAQLSLTPHENAEQSQFRLASSVASPGTQSFRARVMILQNKTSMSATGSSPKMKMWDQEKLLRCWVGQRKLKVILPNKANFSSSSRNQDTSIRHDSLFSEEAKSGSAADRAGRAARLRGFSLTPSP